MQECKGITTPMSNFIVLTLNDGAAPTDAKTYRQVIGKLQYLSLTRPNISFCVNKLSQFMHAPSVIHWQVVKRLLRYLKLTHSYGLKITRKNTSQLHVYSDADWAGDHNDRTSTSGYILYFRHNPISWSSKKQRTVARSSEEVEYRAVASAVAETNWVTNLLKELHVPLLDLPRIYCDNVGATYLCQNPVFHSRMKHIAVDFHFVRDQVQTKKIIVTHIHAADQLADMLTKPLSPQAFQRKVNKLGVVDTTPNLRGRIGENLGSL